MVSNNINLIVFLLQPLFLTLLNTTSLSRSLLIQWNQTITVTLTRKCLIRFLASTTKGVVSCKYKDVKWALAKTKKKYSSSGPVIRICSKLRSAKTVPASRGVPKTIFSPGEYRIAYRQPNPLVTRSLGKPQKNLL